jgi:hypothetical protein
MLGTPCEELSYVLNYLLVHSAETRSVCQLVMVSYSRWMWVVE